jgi:hypothetical protein
MEDRQIIRIETVKEIRERLNETFHFAARGGWTSWNGIPSRDRCIALEIETKQHLYYIMSARGMSNGSEIFFLKLLSHDKEYFKAISTMGRNLRDCTISQLEDNLYDEIVNDLATQIKD